MNGANILGMVQTDEGYTLSADSSHIGMFRFTFDTVGVALIERAVEFSAFTLQSAQDSIDTRIKVEG